MDPRDLDIMMDDAMFQYHHPEHFYAAEEDNYYFKIDIDDLNYTEKTKTFSVYKHQLNFEIKKDIGIIVKGKKKNVRFRFEHELHELNDINGIPTYCVVFLSSCQEYRIRVQMD